MTYTVQANVFCVTAGTLSGITISTIVSANNEEDALNEAKKSFNKYINRLKVNHKYDFKYDNLKIV